MDRTLLERARPQTTSWAAWRSSAACRPHTIDAYRRDLGQFLAFAGDETLGLQDLDRRSVRRYLAYCSTQGYAPRSTARKLSAVRSFLDDAVERGLIAANPAHGVHQPKRPGTLPKALPASLLGPLLDGLDGDDPVSLRDRALLETLYGCGLRVSELAALEVDDVTGGDFIEVTGKGRKARVVPLGEPASRALDRYLAAGRTRAGHPGRGSGAVGRSARRTTRRPGDSAGGAAPRRDLPARFAPLVCHPFARRRGRSALRARAFGAR